MPSYMLFVGLALLTAAWFSFRALYKDEKRGYTMPLDKAVFFGAVLMAGSMLGFPITFVTALDLIGWI